MEPNKNFEFIDSSIPSDNDFLNDEAYREIREYLRKRTTEFVKEMFGMIRGTSDEPQSINENDSENSAP